MITIRNIVAAAALLASAAPAAASADRAEPADALDLAGWSLGVHAGWAQGASRLSLTGPASPAATTGFGTLAGGLQLGYARPVVPGLLLGLEGDVTFPNFLEGDDRVSRLATPGGALEERIDMTGTLRARIGHALGRGLVYGTGGLAWARGRFLSTAGGDPAGVDRLHTRVGWTMGAGLELPVAPAWSARVEYRYEQLARASAEIAGLSPASTVGFHGLWLGLSWHAPWGPGAHADEARAGAAGDVGAAEVPDSGPREEGLRALAPAPAIGGGPASGLDGAPGADVPGALDGRGREPGGEAALSLHGQSTVVAQGYPRFRSPYAGENSLSANGEVRTTVSATAFVGLRPWSGAELYLNPEFMQGFGLADTRGVAGFPNGEAQRSNFPMPRFNMARAYLSQVISLGDEKERVEDGPNQLEGERSVSRLTLTAGKLAVTDFFLVNAYAGEPRTGFLNWNVYGGGSYDWTMDLLSWTWGALAELNQPGWALRAGYFLLPAVSNTNRYDLDVPRNGQWTAELDLRHDLLGRTGKVQLFGWLSHGNIGSYPAALAAAAPGSPPDVASTRGRDRFNYGFVVSLEQPVTDALGLFTRASWSPEQGETMGWTDCGASFAVGGVLKGAAWQRPADSVGVAALVEALSPVAQRYFEAGGRGTIIGDGAMTYRPEQVLEAYYTLSSGGAAALTLDQQLIVNPGYNADRGPVSVTSVRIHAAF